MDEFSQKLFQLLGWAPHPLTPQESAAMEAGLYTVCAAAVAMFSRWMQRMMAFNEQGLPDPSFWNWAVVVIAVFAAFILNRRIDKMKNRRWFLPKNYLDVYYTSSKLLLSVAVLGSLVLAGGCALLISESQTEKNPLFFLVTAVLGIVSAAVLSFILFASRSAKHRLKTLRLLSTVPMLFYSVWLITTYQANSINSVVMDFGLQIISICILMMAVFRLAGIFYYSFKPSRTMFLCMFGTYVCAMNIAEPIYVGEVLMFVGTGIILVCYNWIMICNMQEREEPDAYSILDGFEHV